MNKNNKIKSDDGQTSESGRDLEIEKNKKIIKTLHFIHIWTRTILINNMYSRYKCYNY